MDKQLSEIKRYIKKQKAIAYVHEQEIILLQREKNEAGEEVIMEYILNRQTKACVKKRNVSPGELAAEEFEKWQAFFEHFTNELINAESRETRENISLEAIESAGVLSVKSTEDEYLETVEFLDVATSKSNDPYARTLENAQRILETVLNEKQRRWYLLFVCENLSARAIAQMEGCAHTTVSRSLKVIEKKIRKFLEKG